MIAAAVGYLGGFLLVAAVLCAVYTLTHFWDVVRWLVAGAERLLG